MAFPGLASPQLGKRLAVVSLLVVTAIWRVMLDVHPFWYDPHLDTSLCESAHQAAALY